MRFNKILIIAIFLIFVSSISVVIAEDTSVGDYTFTIPDGYTLVNSTDTMAAMQQDENNAVTFTIGIDDDIEGSKENFISQGKELIEEEVIDYNGLEINLQAFSTPGTNILSYNYIVLSDDGNFLVSLATDDANFNSSLESQDNPASEIFDSVALAQN